LRSGDDSLEIKTNDEGIMDMQWTDIYEIAMALEDAHPDADNVNLRFTDLHRWVMELEGFEGEPQTSNEKILEAIQAAWIEERD
jgi:FeS assembly protein IscX